MVGSLISWMGGGVQPANTGRPLFGRAAPLRFSCGSLALRKTRRWPGPPITGFT